MKVEQIYTGCLAQGAYYITSMGEAAIIDPLREITPYVERLKRDGVRLKYILETHFHADFVSGHLDLSRATGAPIVYGPTAKPGFDAIVVEDGQILELGKAKIKVIHTPGHTMESSCFLLIDEDGRETALFSGDTLFLGDVGRPDLAQKAANLTQEELAGLLYDSLYEKILPLSDDIVVYPGHGAGSACGKNMMQETVDTLGNQKRVNYALKQPSKEAFIASVIDGLLPPPAYFGGNVAMNKQGYDSFEHVLERGQSALSADELEHIVEASDALVLDTRAPQVFAQGFIPRSINIGIDGDFAPWAGAMIVDVKQPLVLVTEPGREEEVITRLSRVGFDNVLGYLDGGFETWQASGKEVDHVERISAEELAGRFPLTDSIIVDVRKESEYAAEHVEEAYSRPLAYINDWIQDLPRDKHFYLHCAGGYRSMIAASILQARGYRNFTDVEGGFGAIAQTSIPKTDYVCQSKMSKQ
ncbi:MBL fold metallo-hydrolase [Porphyromonas cangingivalis]|uniref:Glyoxylase, beta-lactamase superfamily II n=1 Tax=Porphyromonas cangingivalis TaxID=36874 RepID=A0A1T4MHV4_PORCN|nr:MBL fold metallo-hydrolase [Porphyromonas cangingivalis]SJZ66354.1 Glyoxylase, beta-lactamase superfamily II [Porphyromonas cangingivalis]VEJ04220.1 Probable polyketide biosynthesis zinc-dependent hydrolase BaeB [Porphyromonas cangingivalis]